MTLAQAEGYTLAYIRFVTDTIYTCRGTLVYIPFEHLNDGFFVEHYIWTFTFKKNDFVVNYVRLSQSTPVGIGRRKHDLTGCGSPGRFRA